MCIVYCMPFVTKLGIAYGHHVSLHGNYPRRLTRLPYRLNGHRVSLCGDRVRVRNNPLVFTHYTVHTLESVVYWSSGAAGGEMV